MNDVGGSGRPGLPLRATGASRPRRRARLRAPPAPQRYRSARSCTPTRRSSRSGVSRQRPSGLRRQVPLPEQGASTRTRSAASRQSTSALSSCGGLRRRVSMLAPARCARGASFDRRRGCYRWRGWLRPARRQRAQAPCHPPRRRDRACGRPPLHRRRTRSSGCLRPGFRAGRLERRGDRRSCYRTGGGCPMG